jgi:biopolymer transport protein ExbD
VPLIGQSPTIITLSEGGGGFELSIDGEAAPLAELGARTLQHAVRNNPALEIREVYAQARIFLRADQNTAYGNVVEVMTVLEEEGFVKVGIFAEAASY